MKIEYRIYGVRAREECIRRNQSILGIPDSQVIFDDRKKGGDVMYTARKAWMRPCAEDITHLCVMQDDIELCNGFKDILSKIVSARPYDVISLFPWNYQQYNPLLDGLDTPYIYTSQMSGCAIIMPVGYVKPCFSFIYDNYYDKIGDDIGIDRWLESKRKKGITTIPATIQHIGDDSLLCPGCRIRRTIYYSKDPVANWENTEAVWINPHGKNEITVKEWQSILEKSGLHT